MLGRMSGRRGGLVGGDLNRTLQRLVRFVSTEASNKDIKRRQTEEFLNPEVYSRLKRLAGCDLPRVFRARRAGEYLKEPKVTFMTESQLIDSLVKSRLEATKLTEMPPVLPEAQSDEKVLGFDPFIQAYDPDNSSLVLTDITIKNNLRDVLVVVRDPDGTLRHAKWDEKFRMINNYFPFPNRSYKIPKMLSDLEQLEEVLNRVSKEDNTYEFVLDRACIELEPDDPLYITVTESTYQHINKTSNYDMLKSTRHYGPMVFYLVRDRKMDNLLIHSIKNGRIKTDGADLVTLFHLIHKVPQQEFATEVAMIKNYIKEHATKRGELELALNSYLDIESNRLETEMHLHKSHGIQIPN